MHELPPTTLIPSTQLLVVLSDNWHAPNATLQCYTRTTPATTWQTTGKPIAVVLGKAGMAWVKHIDPVPHTAYKQEGDNKSPAGLFRLGPAFGTLSTPVNLHLDYLPITHNTICVDDPQSAYYDQIIDKTRVIPDWRSCENMAEIPTYHMGLVIQHNPLRLPAAGSAIFMHQWENEKSGTAGCTAMATTDLTHLIGWLDKAAHPLLLQLPFNAVADYPPAAQFLQR